MLEESEICCNAMKNRVRQLKYKVKKLRRMVKKNPHVVFYDPVYRSYLWFCSNYAFETLRYCPWCGKKLPEQLDPWDTIMNEYGSDYVKYPGDQGYKELSPEQMLEFQTDEWWKKRGL